MPSLGRFALRSGLLAALVGSTVACASGAIGRPSPSPAPSTPSSTASNVGSATTGPSSSLGGLDLAAIVIPPGSPPSGTTLSDQGGGRATLDQLPLSPDTATDLRAAPGFVNGQWSRFAGSPEDFEASKSFILTWVAQYRSESDAQAVFSILLEELESEDGYGWEGGEHPGLGDEGTCRAGDNPQLGDLHETICLWRRGPLVMIVGGGTNNETPIEADAEAMDARASELDS